MPRVAAEKAREFIRNMARTSADDSVITETSFGDDESLLIENISPSSVFETTDDSVGAEEITKSASDSNVASVFTFNRMDECFKRELNKCGKRFERSSGSRVGKNKIETVSPVCILLDS